MRILNIFIFLSLLVSSSKACSLIEVKDLDKTQRVQLSKIYRNFLVNMEKTESVELGGDQSHLVRVSRKMQRIQRGISGGFDAGGGKDLMQAAHKAALRLKQQLENERAGA